MAVDEVLLGTAVSDGLATFRWYRWSEPTVSLGYFQNAAVMAADPSLADLPQVRRMTGGGAILHDREWTYSFAVPARQELFRHPEEAYDLVHAAILAVLNRFGCRAEPRGETVLQTHEPVLCFSRRDAHDVVWNGYKILGSAQRRRKGALLQHGSLLLEASERTPRHRGLYDLGFQEKLSLDDLRQAPESLARTLIPGALTLEETQQVRRRAESMDKSAFLRSNVL